VFHTTEAAFSDRFPIFSQGPGLIEAADEIRTIEERPGPPTTARSHVSDSVSEAAAIADRD
jgi:hypothetical protein